MFKSIILTTCFFIPRAPKTTAFIPPFVSLSLLSSRRNFVASLSSAALLSSTPTRAEVVCPSQTRAVSSLSAAKDPIMSVETGYLNAKDAAALDAELMSTPGFSLEQLMELAGLAVAEAVYEVSNEDAENSRKKRVLLVCGPGNNGGDGLVAARHLVHFGLEAEIVYPKPSAKQHFINLVKQCEDMNIPVMKEAPQDNTYDIIVDSIFGFSFDSTSTIREPFATAIKDMIRLQKDQNAKIVSVDVPSGWDVDGGDLTGENFSPDVLISLTAPKMSAKKFKGRHFVGGRFLPPGIAEKYGVKMPPYPGVKHELCLYCRCLLILVSSRSWMLALADMPPYPGLRHCMEVQNDKLEDEDDWAAQYQAYLDEKDALDTIEKVSSKREDVVDGENWAVQYAEYCTEKEKAFFESNQTK